jgi:UDP-2,4-diacetamido-2,4,6-trideoxy-beta-L-altropyranose hydrolase
MKKPKIYIRADGNSEIGLGHVIRSLALAEMLKEDFSCIFTTRFLTDYIQTEASKVCDDIIKLPESDDHFEAFLSCLSGDEIVVLDNYFYLTDYQKAIKNKGCKLVCIDDIHDKHFVADIVINHAPGANKNLYSIESYTQLCLGLEYALLRKPFREEIDTVPDLMAEKPKNIFVCFGGTDYTNLSQKTINTLLQISNIEKIFAIIGNANKNEEKLNDSFKDNDAVSILKNLSAEEMIATIKKSDLAIVPSSSILLEIFSIGLPVITGFFAENQEEAFNFSVKNGLALGVNMFSENYPELLTNIFTSDIEASKCNRLVAQQKKTIKNAGSLYLKIFQKL